MSARTKDYNTTSDTYRSEIDTDDTHLDVRKKKNRGIFARRVGKAAEVSEKAWKVRVD